jgi:hypothetical protein
MNVSIRAACAIALAAAGAPAAQAADVGVSVNVAAPGLFGQIDLGGYPQPQVVYSRPVVIERAPPDAPPLYLHVRPGEERNWRRYCRQYDACGRPVYFVRDDWYRNVYTPHYREVHARDDHRGPPDRADYRGDHHGDDRGRGYNDEHGNANRGDQGGRGDHGDRGNGAHDGRGNGRD